MKRVVITVRGGVAEVYQSPDDVTVDIIDYDNLEHDLFTCPHCDMKHTTKEWEHTTKRWKEHGQDELTDIDQMFLLNDLNHELVCPSCACISTGRDVLK